MIKWVYQHCLNCTYNLTVLLNSLAELGMIVQPVGLILKY